MIKKNVLFCKNNGITLVALVITIIILLILAGITINSLTNSGLFGKAQEATKISELKEIEEFARISYMEGQMEEIAGGEQTTMAGVISDLKEKGYKIKEITSGENAITGIALSEENVTVERNTEKTVTYTFVYSEGTTVRYFVEVQGKYYEILFNNGNIIVNTEETNVGEISKEPEVTVISSDSTTIEASKTENGKIKLTAKDKIGDVEITVKEVNSGVTKKITATTRIPATGLSISQESATVEVGKTLQLTATVEPSNTTDNIEWNSLDESVATISDNGMITAGKSGRTKIYAKAGNKSRECDLNVVSPPITISGSNDLSELFTSEVIKVVYNDSFTNTSYNNLRNHIRLPLKSPQINYAGFVINMDLVGEKLRRIWKS